MSKFAIGKLEVDVEIKAPARRFHEFFTQTPYQICDISPEDVQSCKLLEGDWGKLGSVIYWNYMLDGKAIAAKELFEAVDDENNSITFNIIEGDPLEYYKSFKISFQVTPKGEGSLVHWTIEYEKLHGDVSDPHPKLQLVVDLSKVIDAHLTRA